MNKKHKIAGFLFVSPWVLGLLLFTLVPMIAAAYISLTDWSIIGTANFIKFDNYKEIFQSEDFYHSLWVTVRYAIFAVPLTIITSLTISVFLSRDIKGVGIYRVIYYMPAIVSGVAVAIVFKWILDPNYGLLNSALAVVGIDGPDWLYDPNWVLPSYLIMAVWGAGGGILTYMAALKDVPKALYESAMIDGANAWQKVRFITIPMITPIIFYNLIIGIISAFRKFTDAYVLGGAGQEGDFIMVHVYDQAFSKYNMGYATALAWILFAIILALTLIVNITKKYWVVTGD